MRDGSGRKAHRVVDVMQTGDQVRAKKRAILVCLWHVDRTRDNSHARHGGGPLVGCKVCQWRTTRLENQLHVTAREIDIGQAHKLSLSCA